jgi:sulfite reductase alpha subunit-like flavoprotein
MESENNHEISILYGSQTGIAKFTAEEVERELWRYGYKTSLSSMDDYDIINLPEENFIIFVCSTTGNIFLILN